MSTIVVGSDRPITLFVDDNFPGTARPGYTQSVWYGFGGRSWSRIG
jgi:hypothetical protein